MTTETVKALAERPPGTGRRRITIIRRGQLTWVGAILRPVQESPQHPVDGGLI
jgi:hypothetical protein